MKAFQEVGNFIKPSTRFIQLFGNRAEKAVVKLKDTDLYKLALGEKLRSHLKIDNGYVILTTGDKVLGLGLLIDGYIRSQIPKKDLKFFIMMNNPAGY